MNGFDSMSADIQNIQKAISAQFQGLSAGLTPISGQLYKLVCANSGKVLDVDGGSVQDGAKVQQWTDQGGANQHWSFEAVGTVAGQPAYKLVCANSGKVLDVDGACLQNGARVQQWTDDGGANQH
ncbi:MAG TPA: RICIN domain-containing protein, partial [Ktedonobacteraceae bacterium]|nr:RICIN domain-containing protein [Ktedonobacteraceae bacterium]